MSGVGAAAAATRPARHGVAWTWATRSCRSGGSRDPAAHDHAHCEHAASRSGLPALLHQPARRCRASGWRMSGVGAAAAATRPDTITRIANMQRCGRAFRPSYPAWRSVDLVNARLQERRQPRPVHTRSRALRTCDVAVGPSGPPTWHDVKRNRATRGCRSGGSRDPAAHDHARSEHAALRSGLPALLRKPPHPRSGTRAR